MNLLTRFVCHVLLTGYLRAPQVLMLKHNHQRGWCLKVGPLGGDLWGDSSEIPHPISHVRTQKGDGQL